MHRRAHAIRTLLALALVLLVTCGLPMRALAAEGDVHHLAFASDYHSTTGAIQEAMGGMPEDVEYVSLIGDMAGSGRDRTPIYQTLPILAEVQGVFPHLDNTNVSIVWAGHDMQADDRGADILKCAGGYGSGPIYEGKNADGSTAYLIYAIAFNEMRDGGTMSADAAESFKSWVDGVDPTIPIIVLCHMPIQSLRGDNRGALYWNEALNYAATGVEGITSTDVTATITRNVLFLCGHNHSVNRNEFFFGAGGTMEVQIDTSDSDGAYSAQALQAMGQNVFESDVVDEEYEEELAALAEEPGQTSGQPPHWPPRPKAEGVTSNIYYTSLVAGYLTTGGHATLVTIDDDHVTLEKYQGSDVVDLGVDGLTEAAVQSPVILTQFKRGDAAEHGQVSVTKVDGDGAPLEGATFELRAADALLTTFEAGEHVLSTEDEALAAALPGAGETVTWELRETQPPAGFQTDGTAHAVSVSATQREELVDHTYLTATTYTMTIDGGTDLVVTNQKVPPAPDSEQPDEQGEKPADRAAGKSPLPKTGDETVSPARQLIVTACALILTGILLRKTEREG